MDQFTLTEIVDLNSEIDRLSPPAARALHRRLRDFVTAGLLRSDETRGAGEKAPAVFSPHEVAKARVISKLLDLNMGAKSFEKIFRYADLRSVPNETRYASGLENAIAAALEGVDCSVEFELLNGDSEVRPNFRYADDPPRSQKSEEIIAAHDLATGTRVVGKLALSLKELLAPLRMKIAEVAALPRIPDNQLNPPKAN